MKPYAKLASTLVSVGVGIFAFERFGLSEFRNTSGTETHIDGTVLSLLVIVPFVLVIAGCIVFMVGRMRRL